MDKNTTIILMSVAFTIIVALLIAPIIIPILRRMKFRQFIREDGPKSHLKKAGTPTMGGIIFILVTIIGIIFVPLIINSVLGIDLMIDYKIIGIIFLGYISYALIGFLDDYLIVVKKQNTGLRAKHKFLLQLLVSILIFIIYLRLGYPTEIDFFGIFTIELGPMYGLLILLMMVGSSNAVNLTDGLDGLATGLSIFAFISYIGIAILKGNESVLTFSSVLVGALIGFLFYNFKPAKVFMGDTGSLALGAALAITAFILQEELLLILIGGVFVIETLSVILQVLYFKHTKGKRLFKMSPLHHHFELSNWSEQKIVISFWIVGALFAAVAILISAI